MKNRTLANFLKSFITLEISENRMAGERDVLCKVSQVKAWLVFHAKI